METGITLLGVFCMSLVIMKITKKEYHFALAGRIAMSTMLLLTAVAHFIFNKGMSMMLPDFIPFKAELIYLTGVLELLAAIGLLLRKFQVITGLLLILFFIMILPSNIYAAMNHIDLQKATYDGEGPGYLWYRIPMQLFYIAWVYFSAVKCKRTYVNS
ncbi:DoxX family protein [Pedobacter immunditicola]|uniref:DoxX family protein n=1 Tax=Pedobacter immunditicola TaxID=3133440 RepID=UPI0030ADDB3F